MADESKKLNWKVYQTPFHDNVLPFTDDMKVKFSKEKDCRGIEKPIIHFTGLFNPPTPIEDAIEHEGENSVWHYQVLEVEENNGRWKARVVPRGGYNKSSLGKLVLETDETE